MRERADVFIAGVFCAVLLWWGALFPELLLNETTVTVTDEEGTVQECIEVLEYETGKSLQELLLEAPSDRIVCKSKLFELCKKYINEVTDNNDT